MLLGRLLLRAQGRLKSRPSLQPRPIGLDRRREALVEAEVLGEQQGIADRHVRGGEAPRTQELALGQERLQRAKAREEPLAVVLRNLRLAALAGLEVGIAQHQRLRKGEGGFTEMQMVEVGTERRIGDVDIEPARRETGRQVLADGGRFGHPQVAVKECRNGSERVDRQVRTRMHARRKRQHPELVVESDLLQHPERPKRTCADAVVQGDHVGSWVGSGEFRDPTNGNKSRRRAMTQRLIRKARENRENPFRSSVMRRLVAVHPTRFS
ncbi:hypothetical protein VARIO8X_50548 [Burkholderiales bacterium 8X]|nr:hypothetical protein VARIO8X_50548 [Burkholderiales bacterium 8X]